MICAVVFVFAYTIYAASSVKACGTLFQTVLGVDPRISMCIAAVVIVGYTFLGGFSAVCWTDFFQSLLILGAMMLAPIISLVMANGQFSVLEGEGAANFWNAFGDPKDIISGLGWGIGYFGMPHIIIRFMSLKSDRELKKSAKIGISWTVIVLILAAVIGILGRFSMGYDAEVAAGEKVFIQMVRNLPAVVSGVFLSAILAASMSTADSQLLAASSSFASDVYKPIIKKGKVSDQTMVAVGRLVILVIAAIALAVALIPGTGNIMSLVSNAWGVFGAAFGPAIMLSLYWKRFTYSGAVAGIVAGALTDIGFLVLGKVGVIPASLCIYEIIPGAIVGLVAAIIVTLSGKKPSKEVEQLFDEAVAYTD